MKFISLFVALTFTIGLLSQITLTRSNFTEPGDSILIVTTSGLSGDYKAAGANQNWDFSNLKEEEVNNEFTYNLSAGGMIINFQFGQFAPDKYQADMIQSYDAIPLDQITQLLPIDIPIDGINRILKTDEDKIAVVGYSLSAMGQQLGFRSDTIEIAYQFPINYLDTVHTTGYTRFDLNPMMDIQLNQHRKRTSIVDGYGTITTPHNTYKNVIRIHHRTIENNDIKIPLGNEPVWIPVPRTIHEYEWWSLDFKRPVFKIEAEEIIGTEIPTRVTFVYDPKDPYEHLEAGLFPNPAIDYAILKTEGELEKVLVYSLEGKLILDVSLEPEQNHYKIDLKKFAAGRYNVIAVTKENKQSFRLIIL